MGNSVLWARRHMRRHVAPLVIGAVMACEFVLSAAWSASWGASPAAGACISATGPGIPAPTFVASGIPGFHAAWFGQSGYMILCPGETAVATVAYYNSGSLGWVGGRLDEAAYLGTWDPVPGQDRASLLGGDGTNGSPNTGWPRFNRIAVQPAAYVGPGQVSWFQFSVRAPLLPGTYRLALRPLIEGATWMEDYGVFWVITVPSATGVVPIPLPLPTSGWLARLNFYRATAGLPPVTENPVWSNGDYLHALWMVKNNLICHCETPGTPNYTAEGNAAAQSSNIAFESNTSVTDEQFVDFWMGSPFHALGMVDPRLQQAGFGSYREDRLGAAAALDVIRGRSSIGGTYPVYWPGNGATVPLRTYAGGESPDPLQACPGYAGSVGLPVFVQIGGFKATSAGAAHSFTGDGAALPHCVIDSNSPGVGSSLFFRGGVIVIPQQPLQPGVLYTVALTVNAMPYTWSFRVS